MDSIKDIGLRSSLINTKNSYSSVNDKQQLTIKYRKDYAKQVLRNAEQRMLTNSAPVGKTFIDLYQAMTGALISDDVKEKFYFLARQFSKSSVQEAVEYMRVKNPKDKEWTSSGFFNYILKILQSNKEYSSRSSIAENGTDVNAITDLMREETSRQLANYNYWKLMRELDK